MQMRYQVKAILYLVFVFSLFRASLALASPFDLRSLGSRSHSVGAEDDSTRYDGAGGCSRPPTPVDAASLAVLSAQPLSSLADGSGQYFEVSDFLSSLALDPLPRCVDIAGAAVPAVLFETGDPRTLRERAPHYHFTVVLDMDETLGVGILPEGQPFILRPYALELISMLRRSNVEIILWSAGADYHVKRSLAAHNLAQYFDAVIYRGETWWNPFGHTKNLNLLRRNGVVLVDNSPSVVISSQGNAIKVKDFDPRHTGELDQSLAAVYGILETIVPVMKSRSIRPGVSKADFDIDRFLEDYLYWTPDWEFPEFNAELIYYSSDLLVRFFGGAED